MGKSIYLILGMGLLLLIGLFIFLNRQGNNTTFSTPASTNLPSTMPAKTTSNKKIVEVKMLKGIFSPEIIEIPRGSTIVFVNEDDISRWPASAFHPTHRVLPGFDSLKPVEIGKSFSFTFDKIGQFSYHDHLYPEITGKILVK